MKTIALHLLDICQNPLETQVDTLLINIKNGKNDKGIDHKSLHQATDLFYTTRTTQIIESGLSLLKQNYEKSNGSFYIQSKLAKGSRTKFYFNKKNTNCTPTNNLFGVLNNLLLLDKNANKTNDFKDIAYNHQPDTPEVKNYLKNITLNIHKVHNTTKGIIEENINIDNN